MKKFLEKGNNNSLMSLLMLSEDSLEAYCYCDGIILKIITRGSEGNILSKYNYIFGNARKLLQFLNNFKAENKLKGNFRVDSLEYDDKNNLFVSEIKYVTKFDESFILAENDEMDFIAGSPTIFNLKKYKVVDVV